MQQDKIARNVILTFVIAAAFYAGSFWLIEHRRQVNGPWRAFFRSDANAQPTLTVSHNKLGISNVTFAFEGEKLACSNLSATVIFDAPRTNVPFGQVIFLDTTFLPGTVTFNLFGHEIELLPRTLIVNRKEVPWKSAATIRLSRKERVLPAPKARE